MKLAIRKNFAIFLIALVGLLASIELSYVFYKANFLLNSGPSFCTVSAYIDCDAVAKSGYSLFLGVPFSVWGILFYSLIIGLISFPFKKFNLFQNFKNPLSYIFTLSVISLAFSAALFIVSTLIVKKMCILCYLLYLVNIFIFITSKNGESPLIHIKNTLYDARSILSEKLWAGILAFSIIAGLTGLIYINKLHIFIPPAKNIEIEHLEVPPIGNVLGDKDAKIVIMEFSDYECKFCSISSRMMHRLVNEVEGVRVEMYNFPLDAECNPLIAKSIHHNACKAIYYAKAAKKQGKFWDLSMLMFKNQSNLSEKAILKMAESIGLDIKKLKEDAKDPAFKEEVQRDIEKAKALNVQGTPTHVIGIKKYEGIVPYSEFKKKVVNAL